MNHHWGSYTRLLGVRTKACIRGVLAPKNVRRRRSDPRTPRARHAEASRLTVLYNRLVQLSRQTVSYNHLAARHRHRQSKDMYD